MFLSCFFIYTICLYALANNQFKMQNHFIMSKYIITFSLFLTFINVAWSQGESCVNPIDLNPNIPISGNGKYKLQVDNTSTSQFYTYTATQNGFIEMSSAWSYDLSPGYSGFDTWLKVYDDQCNLIFDKDNTPGLLGGVEFSIEVAIGDTYIFEWSNQEWGGKFNVEFIYHELLTDGLTCDDPRDIVLGSENLADNWWGSIYYTYTALEDGELEISTCSNPYAYHRVINILSTCDGVPLGEFDDSCDVEDDGYHLVKYNISKGETVIVKMDGFIHMHHDYTFTASFKSKNVAIPDAEFEKRLINLGIDKTGVLDGSISRIDAESVTNTLSLNKRIDADLTDCTGIEAFINITGFEAYNPNDKITTLDLSFCKALELIDLFGGVDIDNLDFTANTMLRSLYVYDIDSINLSGLSFLESLEIDNARFDKLDLSTNTSLVNLSLSKVNSLLDINLSKNIQLNSLTIDSSNVLANINLDTNINLEFLEISNLKALTVLSLTNTIALKNVSITDNDNLSNIIFEDLINLNEIFITDNPLLTTNLNFNKASLINFFDLRNNNISGLSIKNTNNTNINIFNITGNPNLTCVQVDDVAYSNSNWDKKSTQTVFSLEFCEPLILQLKAYLQGAVVNNNQEDLFMTDDLRVKNLIPITSPYNNNVVAEQGVFTSGGMFGTNPPYDDIVDWVNIELLDQFNDKKVIASISAFIQRDGDIVGLDGVSNLKFDAFSNNYFIALTHRNHIKIRSKKTIALSKNISTINLTQNVATLIAGGENAMIHLGDGNYALPAGDYNLNGQIQTSDISKAILDLGKSGYLNSDMDMNGETQNFDINNIIILNLGKGQQF